MKTQIAIEDINSCGIQAQAKLDGITHVTLIGDNGERGDKKITIYQFGGTKVADTNGDPIWEESVAGEDWADLMATINS